jgi:hypothetical protein
MFPFPQALFAGKENVIEGISDPRKTQLELPVWKD